MKKLYFILLAMLLAGPLSLLSQAVTFSPERGFFTSSFQLSLASSAGGTIMYTTDGTAPTATTGTVYSGPITIDNTSVIRAIAVNGSAITPVNTNTYLFLEKVLQQPANISGWPNTTYDLGANGATAVQDYEMDPKIVNDPAYSGQMIAALKDIPTLSIVMDKTNFLTMYDGDAEFPTSVELIYPNNPQGNEQFNCGIESHSHLRLKRSMRLVINSKYFPTGLKSNILKNAPLNGANATDFFTKAKIVLRGGNNRSWARNWLPNRTSYTEDQWYRDAQIDVSGIGSHGTFVHLYVNGLYWGLFNPAERLDADWEATYMGGKSADWMEFSQDGIRSGDATRFNYLTGPLIAKDMTLTENYNELKGYLDVANFSDYLMISWMVGMQDWPQNNYAGGNRNTPVATPNLFFAWDAEWSWDIANNGNDGAWVHPAFRNDQTGTGVLTNLWHSLRKNNDFMTVFADRVYRSCFNNGKLTDAASRARWQALNNYISKAILGESARWGDAVGDGITRTKNDYWQPDVDRVDGLMNGNVQRFITALRAQGYYPSNDPPGFSQEGGTVSQVSMTNPNGAGTIYYTTNGDDPRLPGGGLSPSALIYIGAVNVVNNVTIKARIMNGTTWSALHEGAYIAIPIDPSLNFTLVNSSTDLDIQSLTDGISIDLSKLGTTALNIRANASSDVNSVVFDLSGEQSKQQTESSRPYALFGDVNGNYNDWTPTAGSYKLTATTYSASGGGGTALTSVTINFTVSNGTPPPVNIAPIANAGPDKTITLPTSSTTLNGSGSDADGTINSYNWTQVSGPNTATFNPNKTSSSPTVEGLIQGTYVFSLLVADNLALSSSADLVTVTVNPATPVDPSLNFTLVNSTTDLDIQPLTNGTNIDLSKSGTTLNIRANAPSNVNSVVFNLSGQQSKQQTESSRPYALFGDAGGNYSDWTPAIGSYMLTATTYSSGGGKGTPLSSATINFTVSNGTPPPANIAPIANAGPDKSITLPTSSTTLNGSGSDADGTVSSYSWTQVSGPNTATFNPNKTTSSPTVAGLIQGTYVFSLVVADNLGLASNADLVTVTVSSNSAPIANAGPDKTIKLPTNSTTLSGSGSDVDGTISSYSWTQVSGPNTATFNPNKTISSPSAEGLIQGTYVFSLVVTDNLGLSSSTDLVNVTVNPATTGLVITSFTLVNSTTDKDIQIINNGDVLNLATLPSRNLNIRANTNTTSVGSVVFNLGGAQSRTQTETVAPYSLFGDNNGNYTDWNFVPGGYNLKGTPYSGGGGYGTAGTTLTINFSVIDQPATTSLVSIQAGVTQNLVTSRQEFISSPDIYQVKTFPNPSNGALFTTSLSKKFEGEMRYRLLSSSGTFLAGGRLTYKKPTSSINFDFTREMIVSGTYYLLLEGKGLNAQIRLIKLK